VMTNSRLAAADRREARFSLEGARPRGKLTCAALGHNASCRREGKLTILLRRPRCCWGGLERCFSISLQPG
jgi:hypothetical protein